MDFRPFDHRAVTLAANVIARVTPGQLSLPTPCPPWTLADLLRHMVAQNIRFAAAVSGEDANAACPIDGADIGGDPRLAFSGSADLVTEAFAAQDLDVRQVVLDELPGPLPGQVVVGFHFTDFLVHAWDVAKPIGVPLAPPADLTAAALELAARIPDQARGPGGPFGPVVEVPPGSPDFDRLLGVVGRDPGWTVADAGAAGRG